MRFQFSKWLSRLFLLSVVLIQGSVILAQSQIYRVQATENQGCEPLTTQLSIEGVASDITWKISNGKELVGSKVTAAFNEAGVYSLTASFEENGHIVVVERFRIIEVYQNPQPYFEMVDDPNLGMTLYSIPNIGSRYQWYLSNGDRLDQTSYQVPIKNFKPGGYSLVLEETNSLGCSM